VVRDVGGDLLTLHRIYLNAYGGKADVPHPKRLMTPVTNTWLGGAVHLYEADSRLALAEGIESALAVRLLTGWPVWSTVTAGGLEAVRIPRTVSRVAIHLDHDPAGLAAGERLRARLAADGYDVDMAIPPERGMDPLDMLTSARHD
jgi:putative DNA primase/helicase